MYPTPEDYTLIEGADPTSQFTVSQATVLLSFLRLALPNSYRGFVIHSETTPDTTGQPSGYPTNWYEWQQRCLWHKPSTNEVFAYQTGLGWAPAPIGINTVGTDQLQDGAVTLDKLAVEGTALQVYRVNATATGIEMATPTSLFPAGTLPVSSLVVGSGLLQSNGTTVFYAPLTAAQINTALGVGQLVYTTIQPDAPRSVLRTNAAATFTEYVSPANLFDANELPLTKISPGTGNANKAAIVSADGSTFEYRALPAVPTVTVRTSTAAAVPGVGANITYAHTLGAVPTVFDAYLVCVTPNNNYVAGDYIHHYEVTTGGGNDERPAFALTADATNLTLTQANITPTARTFLNKTTGVSATFTAAEWNVIFKATLLA